MKNNIKEEQTKEMYKISLLLKKLFLKHKK
jgi:hypothetical protein